MRSCLFEDWLQSGENWSKSKLLIRLRNKNSNAKKGCRKWLTRAEMVTRWGEDVAQAMIDAKENDPERARKEIRPHPELPKREVTWNAPFRYNGR